MIRTMSKKYLLKIINNTNYDIRVGIKQDAAESYLSVDFGTDLQKHGDKYPGMILDYSIVFYGYVKEHEIEETMVLEYFNWSASDSTKSLTTVIMTPDDKKEIFEALKTRCEQEEIQVPTWDELMTKSN